MSARKFSPGDVAVVRNQFGVWNRAICAVRSGHRGFVWSYGVADDISPMTADARPLVVIDPEDLASVADLAKVMMAHGCRAKNDLQSALREFANPTPHIEEPTGLGAVVEDAEGFTWVRTHVTGFPWHANLHPTDRNLTAARKWSKVNAIRVLSPGVEDPS